MYSDADFLAAILAAPDDDVPRLVFADWLEEQGDGHRAEFIRIQIDQAKLAPTDAKWNVLHARAGALLSRHETKWARVVADLVPRHDFRRGFVEAAHVTMGRYFTVASELFSVAPIRQLRVLRPDGFMSALAHLHGWTHFAASPCLSRLRQLDLSGCDLGDDNLAVVVASPHLKQLRMLHLRGNGIGDRGAEALAGSSSLTELAEVDLRFNQIGIAGVRALLVSPHLPALRTIRLEANPADVRSIVRVPGQ